MRRLNTRSLDWGGVVAHLTTGRGALIAHLTQQLQHRDAGISSIVCMRTCQRHQKRVREESYLLVDNQLETASAVRKVTERQSAPK